MNSIRTAIISVTDKSGLAALAAALAQRGVAMISTGGTAAEIRKAAPAVDEVGDLTGAGELLGGRVKTLAPVIFAGILARRDDEQDMADLEKIGARPIDLVVCNLYHFDPSAPSVEKIDIGGVSLIRAAAKNSAHVVVVTDPADYPALVAAMDAGAAALQSFGDASARKAWRSVAEYDRAIATAYGAGDFEETPLPLRLHRSLRYGENPHQAAHWFTLGRRGLQSASVVEGKELSFNNLLDIHAAAALVHDLGSNATAVIKHQNPCGASRRDSVASSLVAAVEADRISAFGGVVAVNGAVDAGDLAPLLDLFIEVLVARQVTDSAKEALAKKKNLRIVEWDFVSDDEFEYRSVAGGVLAQTPDRVTSLNQPDPPRIVSKRAPSDREMEDLRIAEIVAKHVRSNAIVLVRDGATVGVGAGQMNRADSVRIAIAEAGARAEGAVMASDGFFPFSDGLENATGVTAVIQPGGSVRDQEVIDAADRLGMALCFTGVRHFKH